MLSLQALDIIFELCILHLNNLALAVQLLNRLLSLVSALLCSHFVPLSSSSSLLLIIN